MANTTRSQFGFQDLAGLYRDWNGGERPYEHISEILRIAKDKHQAAWRERSNGNGDHGQSWRAWKGKNFEKLVRTIVEQEVSGLNKRASLDLGVTSDTILDSSNLSVEQDRVRRNLLIHYGRFGSHLPDADLVIYRRRSAQVVCIVSCKVSLRERIAQTAYWKQKMSASDVTKHVRVALVTPDEDRDLTNTPLVHQMKKNYAIASVDIDATYVLNAELQPTDRIKHFSSFENDLRIWSGGGGG